MNFFRFFKKSKNIVILTLVITFTFVFSHNILADYMQGNQYRIQSDSLNLGGVGSSSPTYNLNDTLGETGTGDLNSASYNLHAGYWQMQSSFISISSQPNINMGSIGGLSGGSSESMMSWNVLTDNPAGYIVSVVASSSPALQSAQDSLADYTPAGADPDYNFTNSANASSFGFSPEGTEVLSRYMDDGTACNTGTFEHPDKCWDGFSTTPKNIAGRTTSNMPSGSTVSLRIRAETGTNHIQTSGVYNVTITATAVTL
jgi:hypothetical protein